MADKRIHFTCPFLGCGCELFATLGKIKEFIYALKLCLLFRARSFAADKTAISKDIPWTFLLTLFFMQQCCEQFATLSSLFVKIIDNFCKMFSTNIMKKRITLGISFPDETILENAKERAKELGIRSFSDYINQLIKYDLGLPNYIGQYISKRTEARASAIADALKGSVGKGKE